MDWIVANKEWLFSGVGITVVALGYYGIRELVRTLRGAHRVPPFDKKRFQLQPLPRDIMREIDAAPPLHRESRSAEFLGLRVQWRTTLQHANLVSEGIYHLMLLDRGNYPWVYVDIDRHSCPAIQHAREGTTIWVAGTISSFNGGGFGLSEPRIRIVV